MTDVRQSLWFALTALVVGGILAGGCAPPQGFHFDLAADVRSYTPPEHAGPEYFVGVCTAIRELGRGAFMLTPGDMDPPDRIRAVLDQVLGEDYVWYPVVGNHELGKPEYMAYLRAYNGDGRGLPGIVSAGPPGAIETCYSFDYENAHFVVLNQYYDGASDSGADGDVGDALYEWLATDLATNEKPVIFVFGHEPVVSVPDLDNGRVRHGGDSLDKYPENNHRFWTLLRQHGVLAYFCGHTHNLSLAKINGVWQIDCGHARGLGDLGAPSTFLKLYVEPGGVRCEVYRSDGTGGPYRLAYETRL